MIREDLLSPFVKVMMPLNHKLRKFTKNYKFNKSLGKKINHLMYMDDIELFAKNENELETLIQNKNTQSGYRNGIWYRKICHDNNEKRKKINTGRNRTTKSREHQNSWHEGNLPVLRNIGSRNHQTSGDENKS